MEATDSLLDSLSRLRRRVRRTVMLRRRLLAAVLTALAVLAGLQAAAPAPPPTRAVLTAAGDLPAGTVLQRDDLGWTAYPPAAVPHGAVGDLRSAVGRTTTGPLREGEPVTDVRLLSGSVLAGHPGRVAAPVRIADPGAVALLRVGDHVDVLATDGDAGGDATVVAESATVLSLPRAQETLTASGGLVVLAVPEDTARHLAAASVRGYLSVVLTH